jgi:hypothetical protein
MDHLFRDACRRRVQEVNPELDEVAFVKIMEEAQHMYELRLIADACRRRIREERPDLVEFGADEIMKFIPFPPMWLVVSALDAQAVGFRGQASECWGVAQCGATTDPVTLISHGIDPPLRWR